MNNTKMKDFYKIFNLIKSGKIYEYYSTAKDYIDNVKPFLTKPNLILFLIGMVFIAVMGMIYILMDNPLEKWLYVRDHLLNLKEHTLSGTYNFPPQKAPNPSLSIGWLQFIDNFIENTCMRIYNAMTPENFSAATYSVLATVEKLVSISLQIGDFTLKYRWTIGVTVLGFPILKYFNILYLDSVCNSIIVPIKGAFSKMYTTCVSVGVVYSSLEQPLTGFLTKIFGGLAAIITFPINCLASIVLWTLQGFYAVLTFFYNILKWIGEKYTQIIEAITRIFRGGGGQPPGPGPSGGSGFGGGGSSASGGSPLIRAVGLGTGSILGSVLGWGHGRPHSTGGGILPSEQTVGGHIQSVPLEDVAEFAIAASTIAPETFGILILKTMVMFVCISILPNTILIN